MTLRKAHGLAAQGGQTVVVEVLPPDEMPDGVPDARPTLTVERDNNGRIDSPEAARALGQRGGQVRAKNVKLARSMGLSTLAENAAFKPYKKAADSFRKHHSAELAKLCGGALSAGPSSLVASAAWQLAASRFLFDQAASFGDAATFKQASQLANDSRQNLLAAYELGVREAEARKVSVSPLDAIRARIGAGK